MQYIFTAFLLTALLGMARAQPQLKQHAIVYTNISIISTDDSVDTAPKLMESKQKSRILVIRSDDPAEMKSTTWYKGHLLKTMVENGTKTITTIRDNNLKKTTVITEMRSKASGFFYFDAAAPNSPKDSTLLPATTGPSFTIYYQDVISRNIAGYDCQRAVVTITGADGSIERATVWYNTELKLEGLSFTGDPAYGYVYMQPNKKMAFFEQLKGFPMAYQMPLSPGRSLVVEVTKLNIKKNIPNNEFNAPYDVRLQPMRIDWPSGKQ